MFSVTPCVGSDLLTVWLIIEVHLNRRERWQRLEFLGEGALGHNILSAHTSYHKHWPENFIIIAFLTRGKYTLSPVVLHERTPSWVCPDKTRAMFVLMSHRLTLGPWGPIILYTPTKPRCVVSTQAVLTPLGGNVSKGLSQPDFISYPHGRQVWS